MSLGVGIGTVITILLFLRIIVGTPPGVSKSGLVEFLVIPQEALRAQVVDAAKRDATVLWLKLQEDAGLDITGSLQAHLFLAVEQLAQNPRRLRTLTELREISTALSRQTEVSASQRTVLQERLQSEQMAIRQALTPLTKDGAHGNLLDADHDDLQHGSLHVFEQEERTRQVVNAFIMHPSCNTVTNPPSAFGCNVNNCTLFNRTPHPMLVLCYR